MEAGFIPAGGVLSAPPQTGTNSIHVPPPGSKVIRPPGSKRGKTEEAICDRIKLESVFGLTVSSNAALDSAPNSELVAYPAGCTVVLYNTRKNRQNHILNASRKTITCLAFSGCGRYLATGECGHAPCVRIWDLQDPGTNGGGNQLAEFPSHKYGVNCVAFSMNSKYLVSVGSQHDMIVNVWEWKSGLKLASNKVSSKVKAVSFAESGAYFVTVGNRHVKFWYLEYSRGAKYKEPVPLMGRSAILGEQRNNDFCDVACGRGECADSTFAITRSGLLCEFNNRRLLDKWVELRTPSANCMSLGTNYIFVGCADGIVRCFSPSTLQFVTTLPRTHYLGVDVSQGLNISHMFTHPPNAKYPDAIAITYDEKYQRLTCVYNDHSLYVWDVRDIKRALGCQYELSVSSHLLTELPSRGPAQNTSFSLLLQVGKSHSCLYHSACIWGVEVPPEPLDGETSSPLPPGTFMTCSSDDTVRMWLLPNSYNKQYANIYSDELQRVLYMDPDLTYLKDVDLSSTGEKDKPVSYDGKNGVRCIRVAGDGMHLASGDRAGNVRIHDLISMREVCRLEAHNAEVLCLEYCNVPGKRLLASASRDRLIHVFHVDEDYNFMQTLDDHSSSITAVKFLNSENSLQMVSCGADKTILFRSLVDNPNGGGGPGQFVRGHNCSARSTLYDMEVDCGGRHVLAACQDRAVRVYNTRSGRHTKTFRASLGDEGSLIKVVLDRSGIYVATSCTNKSLSVYDYYSGECMATMFGHSELVTGLRFTADCQHLISASGDGCIFVWKVPHDMVVTMRARLAQQAIRQGKRPASSNGVPIDSESDRATSPMMPNIQPNIAEDPLVLATRDTPSKGNIPPLDLGRLPPWAQKTIGGDASNMNVPSPPQAVVRGKWAQRAQRAEKNDYYIEPERPLESDGSKDSSLDSGTDTRIYGESKQDLMDLNNKQIRLRNGPRSERPKSLNLSMLDMKRSFDPMEILPSPYATIAKSGISKNVTYKEDRVTFPWLSTLSETRKYPAERDYNENVSNVTKISRRLDRIRHHTDDSSLGSFKYEDLESTEHDGDVEDISDGERTSSSDHTTQTSDRIIYYPDNTDDQTPSEYTVNAMDVDELRQSQRKSKKPLLAIPLVTVSATSVSGSGQDSDEDDDEVSTPSGDNGDRNPLSGSCESLEKIAQRTSFLKSAFESLSGAEMDTTNSRVNTSISSQHHKTSPQTAPRSSNTSAQYSSPSKFSNNSSSRVPAVPPRNAALISAAKQTMNDPSVLNKRQELTRRIEETKKQLESVGYRSKLKASQSTMDLSYRHGDRDLDSRPPASRPRPLSQNLSSNNGRGYNSDKVQANSLQSTTNPSNNNHSQFRDENVNFPAQNNNSESFYDSLTGYDNNNRMPSRSNHLYDNNKERNPYDIPANLCRRNYSYSLKLEDLNCTHSEFMKKRQEMFENMSSDTERFHTTYKADFSHRNSKDNKPQFTTRSKTCLSYTIDMSKHSEAQKSEINVSPGKVFDRLFPNVNKTADMTNNAAGQSKQPPSRNFVLNLNSNQNTLRVSDNNKSSNSRSILKNYKSCPVSPVSEECKWGDTLVEGSKQTQDTCNSISITQRPMYHKNQDVKKRNSMSYFMDFDTKSHLLKDNGKSLVDSIKSDTEKMIAEITKKYGDLDDYEPKGQPDASGLPNAKTGNVLPSSADGYDDKNDGNFSSDSLEDCSLSQDISNKNKVYTKRVCKKHNKTAINPVARRCVSDYEIYAGNDIGSADFNNALINHIPSYEPTDINTRKSFTLPKNMSANFEEYGDAYCNMSVSQEHLNNYKNNNIQRCYSALTKRCVTMSNESFMSDENSNCSSISNEIFMKYSGQNAFSQHKVLDNKYIDNSQNCSYENLCYEVDPGSLEKHRHSSASFFLNQRKMLKGGGSQESVLSDDLLQSDSDNQMISKTNCNSLESILSDDSEYTRSAPLEILFDRRKGYGSNCAYSNSPSGVTITKSSKSCYEFDNQSKSYGSSPNNNSFTNYMQMQGFRQAEGFGFGNKNVGPPVLSNNANITYGFDIKNDSAHKSVTRSISLQDSSMNSQKKNIAYYFDGNEIKEYEQPVKRTDEIPSMKSKNEEYKSNQSRSLSTNCEDKYKYICSIEGMETNYVNKNRSCSFEVVMEPATTPKPAPKRSEKSHVQKNLEKFESQIRKHVQSKSEKNQSNSRHISNSSKNNGKFIATKSLERSTGVVNKNSNCKQVFDFVPHKPPKPVKRTSSVKLTNRNRIKPTVDKYPNLDSGLGAGIRAKIDGLQLKNSNALKAKVLHTGKENKSLNSQDNEEKSYNIFISEKEPSDSKSEYQMDSLEYLDNKKSDRKRASDFSLDSLDNVLDDKNQDNFCKDSLNYECFSENAKFGPNNTNLTSNTVVKNSVTNKNMPFLKMCAKDVESSSSNNEKPHVGGHSSNRSMAIVQPEDVEMYKDIERKIEILNKLVELEERKIMQAKFLKECRMRPLKANFSDGKGTVKILSKNFEKLASKHQTKGILDASDFFSLTLDDFESDKEESAVKLEMKRNLSLPDVLDVESLGECVDIEEYPDGFDSNPGTSQQDDNILNNAKTCKNDVKSNDKDLKQRVYNLTVIPKTDIHIDSENYESSTTSSSCTNSPKRLQDPSSSNFTKSKTSKLSSLFRSKFDRNKMTVSATSENKTSAIPKIHVKPVISPNPSAKPSNASDVSSGLLRKHPLQQPLLPPKIGITQGGRNRLSPNDFNSLIDNDNSGLRRAISLSDLAFKPSPSPRTSLVKSSQGGSTAKLTSTRGPSPRHIKNHSNMIRSNSVGVLNQSDSESEAGTGSRSGRLTNSRSGGLMRPTISSQNKVAPTAARRRGVQPAYSSVNLSSVGQDDSSSEEANGNGTDNRLGPNNKPAVPPRPPKSLLDAQGRIVGRSGSERDLSAKAREVTQRLTSGPVRKNSVPSLSNNNNGTSLDPTTGQVTPMAAQQLAQKFTKLTAKVVHVYSTLSDNPKDTHEIGKFGENLDMLQDLESAMLEAQKMLSQVIGRMKGGNSNDSYVPNHNRANQDGLAMENNMSRTFNELVSKGQPMVNGEVNQAMCMLDKYSDLLYDVVKDFSTTNGQTHPSHAEGS